MADRLPFPCPRCGRMFDPPTSTPDPHGRLSPFEDLRMYLERLNDPERHAPGCTMPTAPAASIPLRRCHVPLCGTPADLGRPLCAGHELARDRLVVETYGLPPLADDDPPRLPRPGSPAMRLEIATRRAMSAREE